MICPSCGGQMVRIFFDNEHSRGRDEPLRTQTVWSCDPCPAVGFGRLLVTEEARS